MDVMRAKSGEFWLYASQCKTAEQTNAESREMIIY